MHPKLLHGTQQAGGDNWREDVSGNFDNATHFNSHCSHFIQSFIGKCFCISDRAAVNDSMAGSFHKVQSLGGRNQLLAEGCKDMRGRMASKDSWVEHSNWWNTAASKSGGSGTGWSHHSQSVGCFGFGTTGKVGWVGLRNLEIGKRKMEHGEEELGKWNKKVEIGIGVRENWIDGNWSEKLGNSKVENGRKKEIGEKEFF